MTEKETKTARKLNKILNLIPFLFANQGIHLSEIKRLHGFEDIRDLRKEIENMIMFGVTPQAPNDFIDVYVDEDDRIFLTMPQGLDKPISLTTQEWAVLHAAIRRSLSVRTAQGPSSSLLEKVLEKVSRMPLKVETSVPFKKRKEEIEGALKEDLQIQFKYRTLSSADPEIRRVSPWAIFDHRGISYLIGYCHLRNAERYFHIERIIDLEILDIPIESKRPENLTEMIRESVIWSQDKGFLVEIAFHKSLSSSLERQFDLSNAQVLNEIKLSGLARDVVSLDLSRYDGMMYAKLPVKEALWFRNMVRSYGSQMAILSPEHMRNSFREELTLLSRKITSIKVMK